MARRKENTRVGEGEGGRKVVPSVRFNGRANIIRVGGEQTGVRCGPGQHPDEMKKRGELRCRNVGGGGVGEREELPAFAGRRVSSSRHFKHRGVFQSDLLPPPSPPARVHSGSILKASCCSCIPGQWLQEVAFIVEATRGREGR